jgi:urease accessory protein
VFRPDTLPVEAVGFPREPMTLGWEERIRSRARRRTDTGTEFGTALPRGTVLRGGDCLLLDRPRLIVEVIERAEAVLVVAPRTPREWGLFAYYIGNSHQPVMITDEAIVCADVPGMEQVLDQHGIVFSRTVQPFTPVGMLGAFYASEHRHFQQ